MLFHVAKRCGPSGGAVHSSLPCVKLLLTKVTFLARMASCSIRCPFIRLSEFEALPSNYSCGASQSTDGSQPLVYMSPLKALVLWCGGVMVLWCGCGPLSPSCHLFVKHLSTTDAKNALAVPD